MPGGLTKDRRREVRVWIDVIKPVPMCPMNTTKNAFFPYLMALLATCASGLPLVHSNSARGHAPLGYGPARSHQTGSDKPAGDKRKFGDSLKHLKWDSSKGMAVDKRAPRDRKTREDPSTIKLTSTLVAADVLVTGENGGIVTGLGKADFVVSEDGKSQQVAVFSSGDDRAIPRKVVLLIDWSESESAYLASSLTAALMLIDLLAPADQMAIVTSDVQLICGFTSDKSKLKTALATLHSRAARRGPVTWYPRGSTDYQGRSLQFTALFAILRELIDSKDPRQVIIFQTDGDEAPTFRDQPDAADFTMNMPNRAWGLEDILSAARHSPATIYTVIPSDSLIGLSGQPLLDRVRLMLQESEKSRFKSEAEYQIYSQTHPLSDAKVKLFAKFFAAGQTAAAHVAEISGGTFSYLRRPEDAQSIYSSIGSDIGSRYTVGYYPDEAGNDGKLHHFKIEVRGHPEYVVHGRDSYYSPKSDQK